jgi:hypothetical protein
MLMRWHYGRKGYQSRHKYAKEEASGIKSEQSFTFVAILVKKPMMPSYAMNSWVLKGQRETLAVLRLQKYK